MRISPFYESVEVRAKYYPPPTVALVFGDLEITWKEFYERINRVGNALRMLGLRKGDKCAFLFHNSPEFLEINLAIQAVGAVPVPVNYRYVKGELQFVLDNSDAKGFLFEADYLPLVEEIRSELPHIGFYIVQRGSWGKKPGGSPPPGFLEYEEVVQAASPRGIHTPVNPENLAVICYTGGTTGRSKGVMLSYHNFIANQQQLSALLFSLLPPVADLNNDAFAKNEVERKLQESLGNVIGPFARIFQNPEMADKVIVFELQLGGPIDPPPLSMALREGKVKVMSGKPDRYDLRFLLRLDDPQDFTNLTIYPATPKGKLVLLPKLLMMFLSGRIKIQGSTRNILALFRRRSGGDAPPPRRRKEPNGSKGSNRAMPLPPLFHLASYALWLTFLVHQKGATVFPVNPSFDPEEVLSLIERENVTWVFMVPTMWKMILDYPGIGKHDLSSVHVCLTGAALLTDKYKKKMLAAFPNALVMDAFGQTEMAPVTTVKVDGVADEVKDRSVGQLLTGVEARILGERGEELPVGEVGELCYKSESLMRGYYKDDEKTREVIDSGGWFHSGDLAYRGEDGEIYIVERKQECINCGGEKIFPLEVEEVIQSHPKVDSVCVIGVPDEQWGETCRAVVVVKAGEAAPDPGEIIDWCKDKIAGYKKPKSVVFTDSLPLSPVGKVLRAKIKEAFGLPGA